MRVLFPAYDSRGGVEPGPRTREPPKPWRPGPTTATGFTSGEALFVMAARFVTPA